MSAQRRDLHLIDWPRRGEMLGPELISSSPRHHPAVGLRQPQSSRWPGRSLDPECRALCGHKRPGAVGGAGPSVLCPCRQEVEALWAGVEPAWLLEQCPFPAPPHLLLLPPHLLEILSRLAVSASFLAVPPDPSTRWPWPAHPAPACCNLMGSSWGSSPLGPPPSPPEQPSRMAVPSPNPP